LDASEDGSNDLLNIETDLGRTRFYKKHFSPESFYEMFSFARRYVDVTGSSPRGKFYMESVYAMVCARIHLHIDWLDMEGPKEIFRDSREEIIAFIQGLVTTVEEFDVIERKHFKLLPGKISKQKQKAKPKILPQLGDRMHLVGTMPEEEADAL
jgi:hypothetical protein